MAAYTVPTPIPADEPYYDTGTLTRTITIDSPDAQEWFNRGLRWVYGFNHGAAANCFEQALAHDHNSAASYWGLAYASGPNYIKSWQLFDTENLKRTTEKCHWAVQRGLKRGTGSEQEFALLKALGTRFPYPPDEDTQTPHESNMTYADAMVNIYQRFADDIDVAALTADALMSLSPWALWDIDTGLPRSRTMEAKDILEAALKTPGGFHHIGLLHFYIHFIEMSPTPELGLIPGDLLRTLSPDGGHLTHMPSHIDVLADEKYRTISDDHELTTFYRVHDYHTIIYAAMHCGRFSDAMKAVAGMEDSLPHELIRNPAATNWLEYFLSVRYHLLVRFGKWDELIATSLPEDQALYSTVTATLHYAKGVSYAATNRVSEAQAQQKLYQDSIKRVPASRMAFPNTVRDVLAVGDPMLEGEIQYRLGNYTTALKRCAKPLRVRHALAGLLLEQGRVEEARTVYAEDLGYNGTLPRACQHPGNVWALHGYHECLKRTGREEEAAVIEKQLIIALAIAYVPVQASCYSVTAPKITSRPLDEISIGRISGVNGHGDGVDGHACCAEGNQS